VPYVDLLSARRPCVAVPLCAFPPLYAALPHVLGAPFLIAAFPSVGLPGASTPLLLYVFLPGVSIQPGVRARARPYVAAPVLPIGLAVPAVSSRPLLSQVQPLVSSAVTLLRAFCFRLRSFPSLVEQAQPLFAASLSTQVPPALPFS